MSRENVEIISRLYDAWMAGDYETVNSTYASDIRLNPDPEAWWVGVDKEYVGHDGVRRYMRAVYEAFEDYRPEVEQMIDAGEGRVLTLAVEHGRGRGSGAEVQAMKTAHLWTLRDGKAVRIDLFMDRERALEILESQENVEKLRRVYASLNEGVDQPLLELLHPEFIYRTREELPGGGSYQAADLLGRLAELREIFRQVRFEPEEFISSDHGVVVVVRGTGLGRVSGVPVEGRIFHVWKIENAEARELCMYSDRAEALDAVGAEG